MDAIEDALTVDSKGNVKQKKYSGNSYEDSSSDNSMDNSNVDSEIDNTSLNERFERLENHADTVKVPLESKDNMP